jgi:hypothetical protein
MLTLNKALLAELDEWMPAQPTGLLYPQAVMELMQRAWRGGARTRRGNSFIDTDNVIRLDRSPTGLDKDPREHEGKTHGLVATG